MASILSAPYFHNEEAAYEFVESRLWPQGPVCPRCKGRERVSKMQGKSTRIGTCKCYECRKPFTVKVGTIFESSHVKMHLWLQAIFLIASSKKGVSSNQLHRTLGVTLKTAWFMSHRIREAMRNDSVAGFGGNGGAVEVDETFIGRDYDKKPKGVKKGRGYEHRNKVLSLVDRDSGRAYIDDFETNTVVPILQANIARESRIMTDEASQYRNLGASFDGHGVVKHSLGEYVLKSDASVHTNTIEGFFLIFKRGMKGVYRHCSHNHLNRYLAEFDFWYCFRIRNGYDDVERADMLLKGVVGKRLTYQTTAQ